MTEWSNASATPTSPQSGFRAWKHRACNDDMVELPSMSGHLQRNHGERTVIHDDDIDDYDH